MGIGGIAWLHGICQPGLLGSCLIGYSGHPQTLGRAQVQAQAKTGMTSLKPVLCFTTRQHRQLLSHAAQMTCPRADSWREREKDISICFPPQDSPGTFLSYLKCSTNGWSINDRGQRKATTPRDKSRPTTSGQRFPKDAQIPKHSLTFPYTSRWVVFNSQEVGL